MHRYKVTAVTDGIEYILHAVLSNEQIYDDELTEEAGEPAQFNFAIDPQHENIGQVKPLATRVFIYDNEKEIYDGRVIGDKRDILNTGLITTIGALSYLTDTQQEPRSFTGGIKEFIDLVLSVHNEKSPIKIRRGEVTVTDKNDYINRSWSDYMNSYSLLKEKLVETHGGYLRIRHQSGNDYLLDYLSEYGKNKQIIRLGENLVDISSQVDAAEVFTRLIPLGSEIESTNETDVKQYITIGSVNGGKNYIVRTELEEQLGAVIEKVMHYDDITLPENLLKRAQEELKVAAMPKSFEVDAIDLSIVEAVEEFEIGKMTTVSVPSMGVELDYMLTKRVKHLTAPQNDSFTFGTVQKPLSKANIENEQSTDNKITQTAINASNQTVNTGKTITGAKGGSVVLDAYDDDGNMVEPWRILIMDTPDKKTAKSVIQLNVNGIGFSENGINGDYKNAWTIDGKLDASFIQTGQLILGGKTWNRDGAIVVLDASDKEIGRWDKNGFVVRRGTIEGTSISVGPFSVDDDAVHLGDFTVSADGSDTLRSNSGTVVISASGEDGELRIRNTRTGYSVHLLPTGISTPDVLVEDLGDEYGAEWRSLTKNIIGLWDAVEELQNR